MKYVRDYRTGALILKDSLRVDQFKQTQGVTERIQTLETQINSLKAEIQQLKLLVESTKESK